ncbi:MAG: hypothetical protein JSS65_07670 [Armatimonadetes bacterium]|nr:hypothetical protein [Armatimonadota bacterium]
MNSDTKIDKAVEALRTTESPSGAAERLKERLHRDFAPRRVHVRIGLAAVAATGLAVALVAWPRPSYADELQAIYQSQATIGNRHEVQYSRDPKTGDWKVSRELWALGGKVKETIDGAATLYVDRDRVLNEYANEGYAAVATQKRRDGLSLVTLESMLSGKRTNSWSKTLDVRLSGEKVDKYSIRQSNGGPEIVVNYYVRPADKRFARIELVAGGKSESVVELTYGSVKPADVTYRPKPDIVLYDYDKQRQIVLEKVSKIKSSRPVGDQQLSLCTALVDVMGNFQIITKGLQGDQIDLKAPMLVDGQQVPLSAVLFEVSSASLDKRMRRVAGEGPVKPVVGLATMAKGLKPGKHDIDLPVMLDGRTIMIRFEKIEVLMTGSLPYMLCPMNVPFWVEPEPGGAPTKAVDSNSSP